MNVKELIEELQKLDPEMKVLGTYAYSAEYYDLKKFGIKELEGHFENGYFETRDNSCGGNYGNNPIEKAIYFDEEQN